ncbi:hypothetical protein [Priestia flexa]|nr:hypothetical protein [Priestia flexa]
MRNAKLEKQNHQQLGKELELFLTLEEAPGMPFFLPNGMAIRNELVNDWKQKHIQAEYAEIQTPVMMK